MQFCCGLVESDKFQHQSKLQWFDQTGVWGFPWPWGSPPLSLEGFCERENPIYTNGMMTGGSPVTKEITILVAEKFYWK